MLFANQRALAVDNLRQYAKDVGLDAGSFDTCLDSDSTRADVLADAAVATALGLRGTPGFYINGRFLNCAQPFDALKAIIDDELQRKGVETPAS